MQNNGEKVILVTLPDGAWDVVAKLGVLGDEEEKILKNLVLAYLHEQRLLKLGKSNGFKPL